MFQDNDSLQLVNGSVTQTSDIVIQIAAATEEQGGGVDDINRTIALLSGLSKVKPKQRATYNSQLIFGWKFGFDAKVFIGFICSFKTQLVDKTILMPCRR